MCYVCVNIPLNNKFTSLFSNCMFIKYLMHACWSHWPIVVHKCVYSICAFISGIAWTLASAIYRNIHVWLQFWFVLLIIKYMYVIKELHPLFFFCSERILSVFAGCNEFHTSAMKWQIKSFSNKAKIKALAYYSIFRSTLFCKRINK